MALKENGGSSVAEGAVYYIRVSSDPANVCHTGKNVSRMIVEYVLDETNGQSCYHTRVGRSIETTTVEPLLKDTPEIRIPPVLRTLCCVPNMLS